MFQFFSTQTKKWEHIFSRSVWNAAAPACWKSLPVLQHGLLPGFVITLVIGSHFFDTDHGGLIKRKTVTEREWRNAGWAESWHVLSRSRSRARSQNIPALCRLGSASGWSNKDPYPAPIGKHQCYIRYGCCINTERLMIQMCIIYGKETKS